jgi:hypothetical protein
MMTNRHRARQAWLRLMLLAGAALLAGCGTRTDSSVSPMAGAASSVVAIINEPKPDTGAIVTPPPGKLELVTSVAMLAGVAIDGAGVHIFHVQSNTPPAYVVARDLCAPALSAALAFHEVPERHRIAQAIDRRDAMLPFAPGGTAQQIG